MKAIDLHVHSTFSDGTLTPAQLVELAVSKGLTAFALTDHDTTEGLSAAAQAAAGTTVTVIPGIELSTGYLSSEQDVHILGLYIDPNTPSFCTHLKEFQEERMNRNRKMLSRLHEAGYDISYEQVVAAYPDAVITRAHFARFLMDKGYAVSMKEAFTNYLAKNTPYYVEREKITPMDAVQLIKKAGGTAILAHPLLYGFDDDQLKTLISLTKEAGLDGIEAIYSCNEGTDETYVRHLAMEFDLCISGGSDFHGTNKPDIGLGCGRGNLHICADLLPPIQSKSSFFNNCQAV